MQLYHYTSIFWIKNILDSLLLVPTHSVPPIPKLVWLTEEENPPGTASTAMKCYRFLFDSSHPDIIPWPEYAKTITPTPQRTWTAEEVQKVLQEEDEERGLKRSDKRGEPFTTSQELNSPLMGMKPVSFEEMAEAWSKEPIAPSKAIELLHMTAEAEGDIHTAWHVSEVPLEIGSYEEVDE